MFDSLKWSATSLAGAVGSPTPFLDGIATDGITFTEAYACSSICTPSRTSVMTGVHPLVHQVTTHQNRAPQNLPQLSELLKAHGYYTAVCGHYEPERNLSRGWYEQASYRDYGRLGKSYDVARAHGRSDVAWSSGRLEVPLEEANAHLVADRTITMLDGIVAAGRPFFLHVCFHEPHPPFFVPAPYDTLVDPDQLELPAVGDHQVQPRWLATGQAQSGTHLATEKDLRRLGAIYQGMTAYADAQMGRLCHQMRQRGMLEDTWIIVSSDHGEYLGEKGMFTNTESLYECLLHVPLMIRPSQSPAENSPNTHSPLRGQRIDGLVDLVDLFVTILSMAGADVPSYAQGHDLLAWVASGAKRPLRDCVFAQVGGYHGHLGTTFPSGMAAVGRHSGIVHGARSVDYSFIRDPDHGDEAYALKADPWELENLLREGVSDPEPVAELRRRVQQWQKQCLELRRGLGVIPGDCGFHRGWE